MKIAPFKVEEWMNAYETQCTINIAETCCDSVSLDELLQLTGTDRTAFLSDLSSRRLTYGDIIGSPAFRSGVAGLFRTLCADHIISTHGAIGANNLVIQSLVEPGDRVISVCPTYQQLYSIPESIGADLHLLHLRRENSFLPDLDELRQLAIPGTKLICINNPNNPSGALMDEAMLAAIVDIARAAGAYLLCDEVYRGLNQDGSYSPSGSDLYKKGISTGSMSKIFSLAGLRLGWVATKNPEVMAACLSHRDYGTISCSILDEAAATLALQNADKVLARNQAIIKENLALLDAWVESEPLISYVKPKAGTTALLYYNRDIPSVDFCRGLLAATGALLTPGSCFEQEHCARMGYACEPKELKRGLAAISGYIKALA